MSTKRIFIALLSLILIIPFFFSCNKDKVPQSDYDTFYPLDYFPAYPGSYWKYLDSNNDTVIHQTAADYKLDQNTFPLLSFFGDTMYVPVYNGIPIWGYEAHSGPITHSGSYQLSLFLSDTLPVGSSWLISYKNGLTIDKKVSAKDTTITIAGTSYFPTIVIDEYIPYGPPILPLLYRRYYTKDIGLIREDKYNYLDSTFTSIELFDYYINN